MPSEPETLVSVYALWHVYCVLQFCTLTYFGGAATASRLGVVRNHLGFTLQQMNVKAQTSKWSETLSKTHLSGEAQLLICKIPVSLISTCWMFFSSAVGMVNAAGDGAVLDWKLPWDRVSASFCRVVVEGGDPEGTMEALRGQDGGWLARNNVYVHVFMHSCDIITAKWVKKTHHKIYSTHNNIRIPIQNKTRLSATWIFWQIQYVQ